MRTRTRLGLIIIALLMARVVAKGAGPYAAVTDVQQVDEYRVKAAFLYNFAKFVEWPAEAFPAPSAPLNVCVLGVDPFGTVLEDALKGKMVGGRPIVTRRIVDLEPGCHLLFISGSERKRMPAIADRLGSARVLTVSDDHGFQALGGMIELFTDGERVKFNIYPDLVRRSGLRVSSRLIELAENQKHSGGGRR